jgi:iron complex transport system substrate-binding protein
MIRVLLPCVLVAVAACRGASPAPGDDGSRVVSLHDVTTEMVVALGASDRLVGLAESVDATPEVERAVARVARVGELESIMAVEPDVVLGLGVVAEQSPELVARLREAGVEVVLGDPATVDDVIALTEDIARRVGVDGAPLVASLRARVATLTVAATQPRRVFVYDCCDPPFTAGRRTVETELIARAGGVNVFADLDADWSHVSWEEVVARRPELIVVHAYRWDGQGNVDEKRRALAAISSLAGVPVVVVPLGSVLGGLRSVDGLERLRAAIAGVEGRTP